jgi:hypothetical protein
VNTANSIAREIREAEVALEAGIDDQIRRADITDDETVGYLIDKIRKRRALLTIKPEFTPEVVGIAKQIIAFGGAGIGVVLVSGKGNIQNVNALTAAVATFYLNITAVSMIILMWFFFQARTRYPWLYLEHLGNSSQYFYYNAAPLDYRYRPVYLRRRNQQIREALHKFLDSLDRFKTSTITETKRAELKNEITQYHLLMFYQGYLDQYEQQLTHAALYGFISSVFGAILIFSLKTIVP